MADSSGVGTVIWKNTPQILDHNGKPMRPIAQGRSSFIEFDNPEDVIKPPDNKAEHIDKFWNHISEAHERFESGHNDEADSVFSLDARIPVLQPRGKRSFSPSTMGITKPSQLFECLKHAGNKFDNLPRKIREAFLDYFTDSSTTPGGFSINPPSTYDSEYTPLIGGPWSKQLYIRDMLAQFSLAFESWNHHPISHACLQIKHNFVWGRGVRIQCQDEDLQKVWDEFEIEEDFQNKMDKIVLDISIMGEGMIRYFPKGKGKLTFRSTDPSTVWEIITDPEDYAQVIAYWQNFATPALVISKGEVPLTKYIIRFVNPKEVDFMRFNVTSYEKRGRSDLFAALTYLKWLKDNVWALAVSAKVRNSWLWDIIVKGNAGDVTAVINTFPNPQNPGSIWAHNEAVEIKPVSPSLGPQGKFTVADTLITMAAISIGIPPEFLGVSGRSSRAGALIASEPATKHFEHRQQQIGWLIRQMARRVFKAAMAGGLLKKQYKEDELEIDVLWPSITKEDREKVLGDLKLMEEQGYFSKRACAEIAAKEFDKEDYDFEEEQKIIKEDKKKLEAFGEYFNDQNPQGVPGEGELSQETPEFKSNQEPKMIFGNQNPDDSPGSTLTPPKVLSGPEKDAKHNPMGQGSSALRKTLKQAALPTRLQIRLTEADLD